jgi:hypothetical protein
MDRMMIFTDPALWNPTKVGRMKDESCTYTCRQELKSNHRDTHKDANNRKERTGAHLGAG